MFFLFVFSLGFAMLLHPNMLMAICLTGYATIGILNDLPQKGRLTSWHVTKHMALEGMDSPLAFKMMVTPSVAAEPVRFQKKPGASWQVSSWNRCVADLEQYTHMCSWL